MWGLLDSVRGIYLPVLRRTAEECSGKRNKSCNTAKTKSNIAFHQTATEFNNKGPKITSNRKWTKHLDQQVEIQKCAAPSRSSEREYVALPKAPTTLFQHLQRCQQLSRDVITMNRETVARNQSCTLNREPSCPTNMPKLRIKNEYVNDGNKIGNIVSKPARGWLHPDRQILEEGVCYQVRYVGCLEINTSMKILDYETRSQVAKECINQVCEAAGLKTLDRKRKVDRKVSKMLMKVPNMNHSNTNVHLIINSTSLELRVMESSEVIANHEMPNISFASGGDLETLDFIAYVAKDKFGKRACYVLECGGKWAQDVITTIGQAFELRFKEYMQKNAHHFDVLESEEMNIFKLLASVEKKEESKASLPLDQATINSSDPEYYNDLPGKIPPEMVDTELCQNYVITLKPEGCGVALCSHNHCNIKDLSPNLIDFNSEPASPDSFTRKNHPEYVNDGFCIDTSLAAASLLDSYSPKEFIGLNDPFDMQPFEASLPSANGGPPQFSKLSLSLSQELEKEDWFHGVISRKEAEALLSHDGEFLVRESKGSSTQYVLTGMHSGVKKHLLLVDPSGLVRTKDKKFDSISHLVRYHQNNGLPIISAESALMLRTPVPRSASKIA